MLQFYVVFQCTNYLHCVQEKRDQHIFFCNISYKTRAILKKLVNPFLDKFATK